MNWDDVRVFLAVARAGQFVAAARALKVDHATVARRVTALEKALGARLVERRTTGVLLTGAGTRFLTSAERMETSFLQAQSELTDQDVEISGTVRVGAPDGLAAYYLASRFAALAERHRAITIQLVPVPQVGPLSRREVDIAVVLEKPEAGRFVARKLTDYAIGLFASTDYLLRHPAPQRREDLADHTLVGYVEEYNYSPALDYVGELCGSIPIRFQCASAVGQLEAVRAGVGIGAIHDFMARRHPELVRVLPESGGRRSYWLVEHEDTRGIGRIRAVHDFIVATVESSPDHPKSSVDHRTCSGCGLPRGSKEMAELRRVSRRLIGLEITPPSGWPQARRRGLLRLRPACRARPCVASWLELGRICSARAQPRSTGEGTSSAPCVMEDVGTVPSYGDACATPGSAAASAWWGEWATRRRRATKAPADRPIPVTPVPPARTIARLLTSERDCRSAEALRVRVAIETTSPRIVAARDLHDRFRTMVAAKKTNDLTCWLRDAQDGEMASLASGIRDDEDAVRAAIVEPWSNRQTEGQVIKLKLVSPQMYGRGKIDLLHARMVRPG